MVKAITVGLDTFFNGLNSAMKEV